ncbi:MAG: hypothetical protein A2Y64_08950 [Candidatus Coatesbacteria bacterium RBG_13_66_14]|uniref:peptidylprolyl isomerase n=1 Tax=Candidatus Coatesbacteria bacterium RBG_13_66_14 TaxID=1817816 RepID=A0A1F5FIE0_9BACT|nr:MAG: hypothetical protein A2Y64_08950 [Candidatus Coatesbacteria bacterium RBG_13_66_14]
MRFRPIPTFLAAAAVALLSAGCGAEGETILTVGGNTYTIGDLADYYAHLDPSTRPIISNYEDARDYLTAFGNKALLETAAREAGYYENPMAVAEFESWRRGRLISALQQQVTADVTVTEQELNAWVQRFLSEGVEFSLIQFASLAEAQASHERLEAGEDFGRVARETFYMKGPGDIFLAQAGGASEIPLQWSPSRRNEVIFGLGEGRFCEPMFYDLHNEWVYYIFLNRGPAPKDGFTVTDGDQIRPRLRQEMLFERAKEKWDSFLGDLRSRATVEVNQDLLDQLDAMLEDINRRSTAEGLIAGRDLLLSIKPEDLVGLGSTMAKPTAFALEITTRANARRVMFAETISPFFQEHRNDFLVKVNGESVPLRFCTQNILMWLPIDDTRLLRPESRRELLQRFVDSSVNDQLALQEAVELGLDTGEPLASKIARKQDEIAVTLFRQERFLATQSRPTEDEVRRRYEETIDRFVYDRRMAYYLAVLPDRDRAEELRALLVDEANFASQIEPIVSLAELETRAAGEPLARSPEELLRIIIRDESLDKKTANIHQSVEIDEADGYLLPGFEHDKGWISPVIEGERDGVKGYGILYVLDILPPADRTLENDPTLYSYLVDELMREAEPGLFDDFIEELKKSYPVVCDEELVEELFDALLDASRTVPEA